MINPLYLINGACLVFCAGIFCVTMQSWIWLGSAAAFILIGSGLYWLRCGWKSDRRILIAAAVLTVFLLAGGVRCAYKNWQSDRELANYIDYEVELTGIINDEVKIYRQANGERVYYVLSVQQLKYGGQEYPIDALVEISYTNNGKAVGRWGDKLTAYGKLRAVDFYKNPGQFDRAAMKARQGIYAKMSARVISVQSVKEWFWQRYLENVRQNIRLAMERAMTSDDAAALFAMLFGGYNGIRPEVLEAFSITGIIHILSVSGSHITLLAGTMEKLGRLLCLPLGGRLLLIGLTVLGYSAVAGFVPPVVRSAFMGLTVFAAEALGRSRDARLALAYIALLMLIYQPQLLFDISFELSFLATAGLLYIAPVLTDKLNWLPRWLAVNLAVTTAAQLAALPIMAWYFNAVSVSALAANLILVPIIEYLIILALTAVVLGMCLPFLMQVLLALAGIMLGMVVEGARVLTRLPLASVFVPTVGICGGAVYYGILVLLFINNKRWLPGYLKVAVMLAAVLIFRISLLWPQDAELHFIDVGQGDAMLLITPHHRAALFDAGGLLNSDFDIGERVVMPYLRHYGVQRLDYIILTHAHADHAGGAGAVLRRLPVGHILAAGEDISDYAAVMKLRPAELAARLNVAAAGQTILLDSVKIEVVHTGTAGAAVTGNEISNVYSITAAGVSCLITGDLDAAGEKAMLAARLVKPADILKVAHHGSKTSSTQEFLTTVQPAYAVISVGRTNNFGHPSAAVVDRLREARAAIFRTDQDGAVVFRLNDGQVVIDTYQNGRVIKDELF